MTALGPRIRELRKSYGVKAEQLADILGVKRRALTNYETGRREPNVNQLIALADYFGVTLDYLVGRD